MQQLLSALTYLHSQNISHRDIKPENFMLARKGDPTCVKMIDFGLSKDFSGQETMKTMSGSVSIKQLWEALAEVLTSCLTACYSHTTSPLKSSYRTTTLRSTSGHLVSSSTSCFLAKFLSQETLSWKLSEMLSRETSISTMSLSLDTPLRRKSFCNA